MQKFFHKSSVFHFFMVIHVSHLVNAYSKSDYDNPWASTKRNTKKQNCRKATKEVDTAYMKQV